MNSRYLLCLFLLLFPGRLLWASPNFWGNATATPTVPFEEQKEISPAVLVATATPVVIKPVTFPTPTATPLDGLKPKDATTAAIFSTIIPGSGQVYDGDALRGLVFATLFGVGLWQTIDNLSLVNGNNSAANGAGSVPGNNGNSVVKNEDAGELIGLATLAVYGFGIQDAANGANDYNRRNNLSLTFQIKPRGGAQLALRF